MSTVILKFVEKAIHSCKVKKETYHCLIFLSKMNLINDKTFIANLANLLFDCFEKFADDVELEGHLALCLKTMNILSHFTHKYGVNFEKFISEKIDNLFKLSHSENLRLRVQVLRFILSIVSAGSEYETRFYRTLYELINCDISRSKELRTIFKLIQSAALRDKDTNRVLALLKRLLGLCLAAEPGFICACLILLSNVLNSKSDLWKLVEKSVTGNFDAEKREPQFSHAEDDSLFELTLLRKHYHPTVRKWALEVTTGFKKDCISFESDPLIDFSLVNFLNKFILRNPKLDDEYIEKFNATNEEQDKYRELRKKKTINIDEYADLMMEEEIERVYGKADVDDEVDSVDGPFESDGVIEEEMEDSQE